MGKSYNLNILNTQFPIRLFHLLVIIFISYVVSSMHISFPASKISVQEKRWQLKCLREGPPEHLPGRPPVKFFFSIWHTQKIEHTLKPLNIKYELFRTYH